jgi:hypothetical protein
MDSFKTEQKKPGRIIARFFFGAFDRDFKRKTSLKF